MKILVVEDEAMLFFLAEEILMSLGCTDVLHAYRVEDALAILATARPDVALLDINLAGERAYPIAEKLTAAKVPFIFATGYAVEVIPPHWADRLVVQKPFTTAALGSAITAALAERI